MQLKENQILELRKKVHFQYKSVLFALQQIKVIMNKAVGGMAWNKQTNN